MLQRRFLGGLTRHARSCVNRAGNPKSRTVAETQAKTEAKTQASAPNESSVRLYLSPAEYIDSDHPGIRAKAVEVTGGMADPVAKAQVLHDLVRDGIKYDPYIDYTDPETYRASSVLAKGHSYCVGKASLYAALSPSAGFPARPALADVKNHPPSPRRLD